MYVGMPTMPSGIPNHDWVDPLEGGDDRAVHSAGVFFRMEVGEAGLAWAV